MLACLHDQNAEELIAALGPGVQFFSQAPYYCTCLPAHLEQENCTPGSPRNSSRDVFTQNSSHIHAYMLHMSKLLQLWCGAQ
eukprot:scaffold126721_cov21-Tisochrysis_lutea.AAC.1